MIHGQCTTSIEAMFCEKNVIQYSNNSSIKKPNFITDKLCKSYDTPGDVLLAIKTILNGASFNDVEFTRSDHDVFENLENTNLPEIVKSIVSMAHMKNASPNKKNASILSLHLDNVLSNIKSIIKYPIRFLFFKDKHADTKGFARMFPDFNKKAILEDMEIISDLLGCKFKTTIVGKDIIHIKKIDL